MDDDTPMKLLEQKLSHAPAEMVLGYNEFRKYKAASEWFTYLAKASETGILDREEIDGMVADMSPDEVEQELECSFTAAIKGAIYAHIINKLSKEDRIGNYPYDPRYPVDTFWDLGMDDRTTIWFVQRKRDGNSPWETSIKNLPGKRSKGMTMAALCVLMCSMRYRGMI